MVGRDVVPRAALLVEPEPPLALLPEVVLPSHGVSFVSLGEGIDCTTPAGRLQLHVLAALAEFEKARIAERVAAGLARARRNGTRLGRPEKRIPERVLAPVRGLSVREAARKLGVSPATAHRWLSQRLSETVS